MSSEMRHEARQVPSWLIFDVRQKMSDLTVYVIIVVSITMLVIGGLLLARFAARAWAIVMLVFAIWYASLTLIVLIGFGVDRPQALLGGALGTALFIALYRRCKKQCPPRQFTPEPRVARDWMGKPIDPK